MQIAALELEASNGTLAVTYEVHIDGVRVVGRDPVPDHERWERMADLARRGLHLGATAAGFVWCAEDKQIVVADDRRIWVSGDREVLKLAEERVAWDDVQTVVAFVSDDYVDRGVKVVLANGREVVLAVQHDRIAKMDPTYGANEFLMSDAMWCVHCARDIAMAMEIPMRDELFHTAHPGPTVTKAMHGLKHRLAAKVSPRDARVEVTFDDAQLVAELGPPLIIDVKVGDLPSHVFEGTPEGAQVFLDAYDAAVVIARALQHLR